MSVSCSDCGAIASRGYELAHRNGCPQTKSAPNVRAEIESAFPSPLEQIERALDTYQESVGRDAAHASLFAQKFVREVDSILGRHHRK